MKGMGDLKNSKFQQNILTSVPYSHVLALLKKLDLRFSTSSSQVQRFKACCKLVTLSKWR